MIRAISGKHIGIHPQHCHSFGSLLGGSPCVGEAANGNSLCDCVCGRDDVSAWMVEGGVSTSAQRSVSLVWAELEEVRDFLASNTVSRILGGSTG